MDIILEQYRTRLQSVKKVAPATLMNFDKAAKKFQNHLDTLGKRATDLESWDLEEYLAGLDLADTTKQTHWIHIGGAYRYAHRKGQLQQDPTLSVFLAKPKKSGLKIIPNAELRAMKGRIICDRQWLLWHLLTYTGMRLGEIRFLKWDAVDLSKEMVFLGQTKNGEDRFVPVHPVLLDALIELRGESEHYVITTLKTRPVSYDTWIEDLRAFAPGYTAHWFRRTVSQSLTENEVDPHVIKWILGHEPQTVLGQYYSRASMRLMQRAILKLYADDPI